MHGHLYTRLHAYAQADIYVHARVYVQVYVGLLFQACVPDDGHVHGCVRVRVHARVLSYQHFHGRVHVYFHAHVRLRLDVPDHARSSVQVYVLKQACVYYRVYLCAPVHAHVAFSLVGEVDAVFLELFVLDL